MSSQGTVGRFHLPWGTLALSFLVGSVLTMANHGDTLLAGHLTLALAWTVPLTYLVSLVLVVASGPLIAGGDDANRPGDLPLQDAKGKLER